MDSVSWSRHKLNFQRMVGYFPNLCVTIALEGITCRQVITIVQGLWLGETDDCFSSMVAYKTHFNTIDAAQEE